MLIIEELPDCLPKDCIILHFHQQWMRVSVSHLSHILVNPYNRSFGDCHPNGCEVVPHCNFVLHFSDSWWCWGYFHILIGHLYFTLWVICSDFKIDFILNCSIHVFWMQMIWFISVIWFTKLLSCFVGYLHFLDGVFWNENILHFYDLSLLFFSFVSCTSGGISMKLLPNPRS